MKKKTTDRCDMQHPDHGGQMASINRIAGQLEGVKKMIEERRYCADILTQLRAIRAAVNTVESRVLEAHLDACVSEALKSGNEANSRKKIEELKDMYRRFNA